MTESTDGNLRDNDHVFESGERCNHCGMKESYFHEGISMLKEWTKEERLTDDWEGKVLSYQKCRKLYS